MISEKCLVLMCEKVLVFARECASVILVDAMPTLCSHFESFHENAEKVPHFIESLASKKCESDQC
jgi:hypothetical protein